MFGVVQRLLWARDETGETPLEMEPAQTNPASFLDDGTGDQDRRHYVLTVIILLVRQDQRAPAPLIKVRILFTSPTQVPCFPWNRLRFHSVLSDMQLVLLRVSPRDGVSCRVRRK